MIIKFEKSENYYKTVDAIAAGNSVIVLGEAGTGKTEFAVALHKEMLAEYDYCAIATYKGSLKKFFVAIAFKYE